jgi:type I restriction enzyme, S subunit
VSYPTKPLLELAAREPHALVGGPFGSKLTTADYVDEGIPVIIGSNLSSGRYILEDGFVFVTEEKMRKDLLSNIAHRGDIVFTQRGTLGQVSIIPQNSAHELYVISQSQMKLTVDASISNAQYIYYWFSSSSTIDALSSRNSSSGVPHINLGVLRNFRIPCPPLPIQNVIAETLSAYDDMIENNNRRIALLEDAARMLYREWFMHFRFPGHEHVKIVDGLPEGWERRTLGEIADVRLGKMLDEKKNRGDLRTYLANVNVRWGRFDLSELRTMRFETKEIENYGLMHGDIVMCEGGEPGRCALWKDQLSGMVLQKALHRIRCLAGLDYYFLYYCLSFMAKSGRLAGLNTGATIKHLPREKLITVRVEIPPQRLVRQFADYVAPIEGQIRMLEAAVQRASEARDLLLPRLMSGEIAV